MPPRAGLNEDVIASAAAEVADEVGLPGVTLAAVADRLRVRAPSLYKHVDGLAGLLRCLSAHASEEMARRLTRVAIGKSGEHAVLAIADAYREYARERPGLYAATLRAPDENEHRRIKAAQETLNVIGAALDQYALPPDILVHAIRGLRSVIHGFVVLEWSGSFGMPESVDQSFSFAIRTYLRGLQSDRPERAPPGR